jgi:hypothetical protein
MHAADSSMPLVVAVRDWLSSWLVLVELVEKDMARRGGQDHRVDTDLGNIDGALPGQAPIADGQDQSQALRLDL